MYEQVEQQQLTDQWPRIY